ncbi:hypothetical protein [Cellulomonas composti]|uniref:Uncharacterized protein n=1 Tax=Cellulomonas composti TaxID=266130 RepID=A0A511JD82_9CELL|nr:hypothetical protein [Cellulomonas composti]GEL95934.1 hypothetical protein CCO02nite_25920 [Cellulomonas composti]
MMRSHLTERRRARSATASRIATCLVAAVLVALGPLAACSSAPDGSTGDDPTTTAAPSPPPVQEPQPARTGLESPLPELGPQPAFTNAAPGDGTVVLAADLTTACLFYSWVTETGAPELVDGVTFEVTGATFSTTTAWRLDATGCPDAACPTLGPDATSCTLGFVHDGAADPADLPQVSVAGTFTCGPPLDDDACADLVAQFETATGAVLPFSPDGLVPDEPADTSSSASPEPTLEQPMPEPTTEPTTEPASEPTTGSTDG